MRPYGEVLNDIRADKNVSISAIEQFGISKLPVRQSYR